MVILFSEKRLTKFPRICILYNIKNEMEERFMLTDLGKISRKLRIDNNELLLDMATYLGVSTAFRIFPELVDFAF